MKNLNKLTGRIIPLFALGLVLAGSPVWAEVPHLLSVHGSWKTFDYTEDGKKVCYMAAEPGKKDSSNPKDKRGDVFALITDRPADGTKNVFSYIAGYTYKPGASVTLAIDKEHFTLFTQDDTAWASDGAADNKIAAAIRKGKTMVIKGVSAHDVKTTDSFTLSGAGGAYNAISKDCSGKKGK